MIMGHWGMGVVVRYKKEQIGDGEEEVGSVAIKRGAWIQIDLSVLNISTSTQAQAIQTKYHF